MGSALVEIQPGLDTIFIPHHLFCNEIVVSGRIVSCSCEEDGRKAAKSLRVRDWTEQERGVVRFQVFCSLCQWMVLCIEGKEKNGKLVSQRSSPTLGTVLYSSVEDRCITTLLVTLVVLLVLFWNGIRSTQLRRSTMYTSHRYSFQFSW